MPDIDDMWDDDEDIAPFVRPRERVPPKYYKPSRLSSAVYQNGWTQWHYVYDGDGIPPQGFFGPASNMMRKGDHIVFVSLSHTGTLAVAHVSTGVVTAFIGWSVPMLESGE